MNRFDQHRDALDQVRAIIPGLEQDAPLFHAPWQARIFALIVAAVKQGHLPWQAFQAQLVKAISASEFDHKHGGVSAAEPLPADSGYFDCWLAAVEATLKQEGIIADEDVGRKIEEISCAIAGIRSGQLSRAQPDKNHA